MLPIIWHLLLRSDRRENCGPEMSEIHSQVTAGQRIDYDPAITVPRPLNIPYVHIRSLEGPTLEAMSHFQRQDLERWNFVSALSKRTFPSYKHSEQQMGKQTFQSSFDLKDGKINSQISGRQAYPP